MGLSFLAPLLAAPPVSGAAPDVCQQLIVDGGFENGGQSWTKYSQSGSTLIDAFYRHTGQLGAWLGGKNNALDRLSQQVALPPGPRSIKLTFWWALTTEENPGGAFDKLQVDLYRTDGSTLIATLLKVDNSSAEAWVWNPATFDLNQYAGQTIQLRFTATTDSGNPTSFFVDDVSLLTCAAGPNDRKVYLPVVPRK